MPPFARSLAQLLRTGGQSGPGAPRLTWYGPEHERVELSGKVLDNWVAKTANFLQEELDGSTGMTLAIDSPSHWKSLILSFGSLVVGMELDLDAAPESSPDVLVTSWESTVERAEELETQLVTMALGALTLRWPGELPRGVVDYTSEIRSHGDVFTPWDSPAPGIPVLRAGGMTFDDAGLADFTATHDAGAAESAERRLVRSSAPLAAVLAQALDVWQRDGSLVLVHPDIDVTEHLLATERITRVV